MEAYNRVYKRCGIGALTLTTVASGGAFSRYSHEFQTITPHGEDVIYKIPGKDSAVNKELITDRKVMQDIIPGFQLGDESNLEEVKAIEVGNIFKLGSRFTEAFDSSFDSAMAQRNPILMGCYGIGPSRVMGTIAECLSDERGLYWPHEVAPYHAQLISLLDHEEPFVAKVLETLERAGLEVLFDERPEVRAGVKFADADLLGMPFRLVASQKTKSQGGLEIKARNADDTQILSLEQAISTLTDQLDS